MQGSTEPDMSGHVFPNFIIFWQELEQNPSYVGARGLILWHAVLLYLNQAQVWERNKGEVSPWAYKK